MISTIPIVCPSCGVGCLVENDTIRGYQHYRVAEGQQALNCALRALEKMPADFGRERALAKIIMAISLQMTGDIRRAYDVIHDALRSDGQTGSTYHGRMLIALGLIQWMECNLTDLLKTGSVLLKMGGQYGLAESESEAWGLTLRGIALYHLNRLTVTNAVVDPVDESSQTRNRRATP